MTTKVLVLLCLAAFGLTSAGTAARKDAIRIVPIYMRILSPEHPEGEREILCFAMVIDGTTWVPVRDIVYPPPLAAAGLQRQFDVRWKGDCVELVWKVGFEEGSP